MTRAAGSTMTRLTNSAVRRGASDIDWGDGARRQGVDPYLMWADLTGFAYLTGKGQQLRVGLHCREGYTCEHIRALDGVRVPPGFASRATFCTALIAQPTRSVLLDLHKLARVILAEPGMASPEANPALPTAPANQAAVAPAPLKARVVVGVIDGLCGFANRQFCKPSRGRATTRIGYFWDQERGAAEMWRVPGDQGYGRELDRATIDGLLAAHLDGVAEGDIEGRRVGELALYRAIDHPLPDAGDWSHGTHVLDLVAGTPDPSSTLGGANPDDAHIEEAGLVYVQLPRAALRDTSSHWAAAYVLDALQYVVARARPDADIVVNISLGSFAGPHDGSSMLEQAIDECIQQSQGRLKVVVAAGNAYEVIDDATGNLKACHARVLLDASGGRRESSMLEWCIDDADLTESFLEIWLPQHAVNNEQAKVSVSLRNDGASLAAGPASADCLLSEGEVVAALFNASGGQQPVPNGAGGMVLAAIGNTRNLAGTYAPAGLWQVTIKNDSSFPITVDAWVERRDIPGDLDGSRPQYGFAPQASYSTAQGTLATLANGRNTIVVGASDVDDSGQKRIAAYSSSGQAQKGLHARTVTRHGPDLTAPGRVSAAGFWTGSTKELAGTSMAAALVSRRLACALVGNPKAPEHRAIGADALSLIRPAPRRGSGEPLGPPERAGQFGL